MPPSKTLDEQLWSRLEVGDCWEWAGARSPQGYGQLNRRGERWLAHRLVWTVLVGGIPEGMHMDHLCRNPPCCNPDHLEVVTQRQNKERGIRATRVHCGKGHRYEVRVRRRGGIERYCRTCTNARRRERARERAKGVA